MANSIAKDFRFFSLLRFAFPTMVMMVFMSLYTIVDGIFISRFVGSNALSATNIVYPVINLLIALRRYAFHRRQRTCRKKAR